MRTARQMIPLGTHHPTLTFLTARQLLEAPVHAALKAPPLSDTSRSLVLIPVACSSDHLPVTTPPCFLKVHKGCLHSCDCSKL
jgi:hypothetical protein